MRKGGRVVIGIKCFLCWVAWPASLPPSLGPGSKTEERIRIWESHGSWIMDLLHLGEEGRMIMMMAGGCCARCGWVKRLTPFEIPATGGLAAWSPAGRGPT